MKRIDTSTKSVDKFGAGKHGFTNGNPATPIPATQLDEGWFDHVQEEIANVIEGVGDTLDAGDRTQLRQAIQAMIVGAQKAVIVSGVTFEASVADGEAVRWDSGNTRFDEAIADGTANNRAVGIADVTNSRVYLYGECPLFSGLTPGSRYYLDASTAGAITATAPPDSIQIGIAKSATTLWVDVDTSGFLTQAAADARYTNIGYMLVADEKAQGTHGGSASATTTATRTLNTVSANTISGASLASNQITLPAGTYRIKARVPGCHVNTHKAGLYNVTDSSYALMGSSENTTIGADDPVQTCSVIVGRLVLASQKVFEVRHYTTSAAATSGQGTAVNALGVEVYTTIEIIKEA